MGLDIDVDNSGTASAGNFYISSRGPQRLFGYAADGTPLPGFPFSPSTVPCGIGVDTVGNFWVGNTTTGIYQQYSSAGAQTSKILTFGKDHGGCQIASDSVGNLFLSSSERLIKYDPISKAQTDLSSTSPGDGEPITFDRPGNSLFTREESHGPDSLIAQLDSSGDPITEFGAPDPAHFSYDGLHGARDLTVNPLNHDVYAMDGDSVDVFSRDGAVVTVPTLTTNSPDGVTGVGATLHGAVDPDGVDTTDCHFQWGTTLEYGNTAPCAEGNVFGGGSGENPVSATIGGLSKGTVYHYRVVAENAPDKVGIGRDVTFTAADRPQLGDASVSHVTTDSARVSFDINPNGGATGYHVAIDGVGEFPDPDAEPAGLKDPTTNLITQSFTQEVSGLDPDTPYTYRVIATNASGETEGDLHSFKTFPATVPGDPCPNSHVRQQTSAALLLDCRAYELVSAPDTGGYDVRSDLTQGITPLPAYPRADDEALYSMRSGTIPGIAGNPTNRGADPYVATRGGAGWSTRYVGIPANVQPSTPPFSSTLTGADDLLGAFAFGGPDICNPCFSGGAVGQPLRKADGSLVQGMVGAPGFAVASPVATGVVKKPLSADGTHFVFGSKQQFTSAGNNNGTDATIYDRNIATGTVRAVSVLPNTAPIQNGATIAELDISADGSRILIGQLVSTDAAGNNYYHLYMHVGGAPNTIDLTPGATNGVLYDGMSSNGTKVYFTAKDALATTADQDTDTSADIYRADVGASSVTLTRVSSGAGAGNTDSCDPAANSERVHWNAVGAGADCGAVAVGGRGGVAATSGAIYFFSPELLDTSGPEQPTQEAPNLYLARPGQAPRFVATLESSANEPLQPLAHLFQRAFGTFSYPEGVAIDHLSGSSYVLDTISAGDQSGAGPSVRKFDSAGALDPSFGTAGKITGSATPDGSFSTFGFLDPGLPTQLAVDNNPSSASYRDLYVPDIGHGVVHKYGPSGNYISSLTVSSPAGVAVNQANGNVYVSSFFSSDVSVFNPKGGFAFKFALAEVARGISVDSGVLYAAGESSTGSYSLTGTFINTFDPDPSRGVATDPNDHHVYIDKGDRVVEYDSGGIQVGAPIGVGLLSDSVSLGVDSGQLVISDPTTTESSLTDRGGFLPTPAMTTHSSSTAPAPPAPATPRTSKSTRAATTRSSPPAWR